MRTVFLASVVFAATALPAAAQATDHAKHQQAAAKQHEHKASAWKEMDAFHTLLGATFHPAKDKQDFKPLREKADQLAAAARAWTASTAPASCASDEVKSAVATISTDALAIGNQVLAKASDEDLLKAITGLHEKFEAVEHKCMPHDMKGMKH